MKYTILILALALISCSTPVTDTIPETTGCTIETDDHTYDCDEDDIIVLTAIPSGVKINTTKAVERINIYHNSRYHSAIITNGTMCHNQSVSSTTFEDGDILTIGVDKNIAKEITVGFGK